MQEPREEKKEGGRDELRRGGHKKGEIVLKYT